MTGSKELKNNGIENIIPLEFAEGRPFSKIVPAMESPFITIKVGRRKIKVSSPEGVLDKYLKIVGLVKDRDYIPQHPIGPYTADFFVKPAIVVEVEGRIYRYETDPDRNLRRVDYLQSLNYRVLRFFADYVREDPLGIAKYIKEERIRQIQNLSQV